MESFLSKALESPDGFLQYGRTCIALLSGRLPDNSPLPSNAQAFFLHLVDKAVASPTCATLHPVFALLEGACQELLHILPSDTLTSLAEHVFRILKNINNVEGEPLYLLCLGIIKALSEPRLPKDKSLTSPVSSASLLSSPQPRSPEWRIQAARSYFSGSKAANTLKLIALQVLWACRDNAGLSISDASQCLDIANSTVECLDKGLRHGWSRSNANIIRKILEKISRPEIPSSLKLRGLIFLGLLADDLAKLPNQPVATMEHVLQNIPDMPVSVTTSRLLVQRSISTYGPVMSQAFINSLFRKALKASCGLMNISPLALRSLSIFMEELARASESNPNVQHLILRCVQDTEICRSFQDLINTGVRPRGTCSAAVFCDKAYFSLHCGLIETTAGAILVSSILESSAGGKISPHLVKGLLNVQNEAIRCSSPCDHRAFPRVGRKAETVDTQNSNWRSDNWKTMLEETFAQEAQIRHSNIVQMVGEICQDLEERCADAEKPFREEQARHQEITSKYQELQRRAAKLETEAAERESTMLIQMDEEQSLHGALRESESRNGALIGRVEELEQALNEANEKAQTEMESLREELDIKDLQHKGVTAAKNEELEILEHRLQEQSTEKEELQARYDELDQFLGDKQAENAELSEALRKEKNELSALKEALSETKFALQSAQRDLEQRCVEVESLKEKVEVTGAQVEAWQAKHEGFMKSTATEMATLKAAHSTEIREVLAKRDQLKHKLDLSHGDLQAAKDAHGTTKLDIREKSDKLREARTEIKQLEAIVAEKSSALEEVEAMRERMMVIMGMGTNNQTLGSTINNAMEPNRRRSRRATIKTPATQDRLAAMEAAETATPSKSFESSTSSSSGGPTPKRTKPRAACKLSTVQKPSLQSRLGSAMKRASMPASTRRPLEDVSTGRGNQTARPPASVRKAGDTQALTQKKAVEFEDIDVEGLDFDESEFFTSTPAVPKALGDEVNENYCDETTAEF